MSASYVGKGKWRVNSSKLGRWYIYEGTYGMRLTKDIVDIEPGPSSIDRRYIML
jgi:hypothetical protein